MDDGFFGLLFFAAVILIIGMALGSTFKKSIINDRIEVYGKYVDSGNFICEAKE